MATEQIKFNANPIDWATRDTGFIPASGEIWFYYNNSSYPNTIIYVIGDGINTIDNLTITTPINNVGQDIEGQKSFKDNIVVGDDAGSGNIIIDSGTGDSASVTMTTEGLASWDAGKAGASGDYVLNRYDSLGAYIDSPFRVKMNDGGLYLTETLDVEKTITAAALATETVVITTGVYNNLDVENVGVIRADTDGGSITINGLVGGEIGQTIQVLKRVSANTLTLAHLSGSALNDVLILPTGANEVDSTFSNRTLTLIGGAWIVSR